MGPKQILTKKSVSLNWTFELPKKGRNGSNRFRSTPGSGSSSLFWPQQSLHCCSDVLLIFSKLLTYANTFITTCVHVGVFTALFLALVAAVTHVAALMPLLAVSSWTSFRSVCIWRRASFVVKLQYRIAHHNKIIIIIIMIMQGYAKMIKGCLWARMDREFVLGETNLATTHSAWLQIIQI